MENLLFVRRLGMKSVTRFVFSKKFCSIVSARAFEFFFYEVVRQLFVECFLLIDFFESFSSDVVEDFEFFV